MMSSSILCTVVWAGIVSKVDILYLYLFPSAIIYMVCQIRLQSRMRSYLPFKSKHIVVVCLFFITSRVVICEFILSVLSNNLKYD